jgi:hypothetical protein
MSNQKKGIQSAVREPSKTSYLKRYDGPLNFSFPEDFDLSRYNLLLAESVHAATHTNVLLYWQCEERCRANEALVEKRLGINNPQIIGEVIQVVAPPKPRWTESPETWGKWLLSAAALFGALSVIRDNFTEFFETPDVIVFVPDSTSPNYHAGDPLDIPLKVRNQARGGKAEVQINSVSLKPLDEAAPLTALQPDISRIIQLQASQNADVHLSGTAPEVPNKKAPQRYAVELHADAKEGYFIPKKPVAYRPFTITAWPDRSWKIQVSKSAPNVAKVVIVVSSAVSVAKGLRGHLIFTSKGGLQTQTIIPISGFTSTDQPIILNDGNASEAKIEFVTDSLDPFRRYSYSLALVFRRPLTPQEWNSLQSWIEVNFA